MTEYQGIPKYADDTSTAYDDADRPGDPEAEPTLPTEEPRGVDQYGVTPQEEHHGEPLAARLVREQPDTGLDDPHTPADPALSDETSDPAAERTTLDTDIFGVGPTPVTDPREPASSYDLEEERPTVGRIVEFDEGAHTDTEEQSIAYNSGEVDEQSAEEAAMYELPDDELPDIDELPDEEE